MAENEQLTRNTHLNEWITTVAANLPHLSKPQAMVLALWSFGMVLAKCCALTAVVLILAPLLIALLTHEPLPKGCFIPEPWAEK